MPKDRILRGKRKYTPYGKRKLVYLMPTRRSRAPVMPFALGRNPVHGFPSELVCRLRYCDTYNLTSTAGSLAKQVWRANSLVDPDFTGAGHQPMYFDQYAALYENYVVIGSKIKVTVSPVPDTIATAQPQGPFELGMLSEPNGTTSSTASTLSETPGANSSLLTIAQGGNNVRVFTQTYSPTKDLGTTTDDDTVSATISSSPSSTWFWTFFVRDVGLSSASTVIVKCEIDFLVKFKRRQDIAGS